MRISSRSKGSSSQIRILAASTARSHHQAEYEQAPGDGFRCSEVTVNVNRGRCCRGPCRRRPPAGRSAGSRSLPGRRSALWAGTYVAEQFCPDGRSPCRTSRPADRPRSDALVVEQRRCRRRGRPRSGPARRCRYGRGGAPSVIGDRARACRAPARRATAQRRRPAVPRPRECHSACRAIRFHAKTEPPLPLRLEPRNEPPSAESARQFPWRVDLLCPRSALRGQHVSRFVVLATSPARSGRLSGVHELELLDWKRRIFALYADVRAAARSRAAWRPGATDATSPVPGPSAVSALAGERERFRGPPLLRLRPCATRARRRRARRRRAADVTSSGGETVVFRRFGAARFELAGEQRQPRPLLARGLRRRRLPPVRRRDQRPRDLRRRPLPSRHRQGRRSRRGATAGSCSTSTSPTTRRARTTRAGSAR